MKISVSLVMGLLLALLVGCSDDDGPGKADGPVADVGGKDAAVDSKRTDYMAADQATRDRQLPDTQVKDRALSDVHVRDIATKRDAGGVFPCGKKTHCTTGNYCYSMTPGVCGGSPVPDSGVCPPDCTPTTCGSRRVCFCISYSCKSMPSGCNDCTCLQKTLGPACSCKTQYGGFYVTCAAP